MQRGKMEILEPVWWEGDAIGYIDQRALPHVVERRRASTTDDVVEAIATLAVRGAPAIGVFGAYGVALAARRAADRRQPCTGRRSRPRTRRRRIPRGGASHPRRAARNRSPHR